MLRFRLQLTTAFQSAGGDQVRTTMAQVEKQFGALEREHTIRTKNPRDAVNAARTIERGSEYQDGLSEQPTLEELQALTNKFAASNPEERPALDARVVVSTSASANCAAHRTALNANSDWSERW